MRPIGKNKSIKNQIQQAINNNFEENTDKRAYKQQENQNVKIFSYSEKFRLLDTAKMLSNYIKENFPDVKQIKDVTPEVIQSFLNDKAQTCTQNTVNTYTQSLNKIAEICNKNYSSCKLEWKKEVVIPKAITQNSNLRGVKNQMPVEDLQRVCEYAKNNYSQSGQIVLCQQYLGIRVNELVTIKIENIDFKKDILHLKNCKGGKRIDRVIDPELKAILLETIEKNNITSGKIFSITENSVNTYLRRTEEKLGIVGRYSTHNIRSTISQLKYNKLKSEGLSIKESMREVSLWLNHGEDRERLLLGSYIRCW